MTASLQSQIECKIVRSALWAAYGDALGFITELGDSNEIRRRIGQDRVTCLSPWSRRIGGKMGVPIELPPGCYSDDTQLRLATSRSIRGNGKFDVEAFSKIELPVWLCYALGAGRGTKAAAGSLERGDKTWYSNFFTQDAAYTNSGGNGAAMRVQPHVWSAQESRSIEEILLDVLRNTISTHGHPHALIGAAFHVMCLHYTILHGLPGVLEWSAFVDRLNEIPSILQRDDSIAGIWLPNWDLMSEKSFQDVFRMTLYGFRSDVDKIVSIFQSGEEANPQQQYARMLDSLGGRTREFFGTGSKTALLAAAVAHLFPEDPVCALETTANSLGSDTDTIGTMAGALIGCHAELDPPQPVLDSDYIRLQAARLALIRQGQATESFQYPDLLTWRPPRSPVDMVTTSNGELILSGLGKAQASGPLFKPHQGNSGFQWLRLEIGQTILAKRRIEISAPAVGNLPVPRQARTPSTVAKQQPPGSQLPGHTPATSATQMSLDEMSDLVIRSEFAPRLIGELLLQLSLEQPNGVDRAVAFAAIVAKAKVARVRRDQEKKVRS